MGVGSIPVSIEGLTRPLREIEVDYEIDHGKCEKCEEKPCLNVCPVDAIHQNTLTGKIEIDEKCIGCILCREACPYDAISMKTILSEPIRENVPIINPKLCRACGACVSACRTGAIHLISSGEIETHSEIDEDKCVRCGYCARTCPTEAIKYGEILPRSVVGGRAIRVNQDECIGCMTCLRVCPSKGAINVSRISKLPYINPSYCARCEECMNVCPSAAIRYSSRKRAYNEFLWMKIMDITSDIIEKESEKLIKDLGMIDQILEAITLNIKSDKGEEEFEEDVTDLIKGKIEDIVDSNLTLIEFKHIIDFTRPSREIGVMEENCIGCGQCIDECPLDCIDLEPPSPIHIGDECVYCGACTSVCPVDAIRLKEEKFEVKDERIYFKRVHIKGLRKGELIIDDVICQGCEVCVNQCPVDALELKNSHLTVDMKKCIICGKCESICPVMAIKLRVWGDG